MNLNDYQREARLTAVYPFQKTVRGMMYPAFGLMEEAGEVAGKIAKAIRDDSLFSVTQFLPDRKAQLKKELGDVLWMLSNLTSELGWELEDIATENLKKLRDRADRGVLKGSGDER